jgi:hypothetical protein
MRIVKPPSSLADLVHPFVFLAGSIELGNASPWQDDIDAAVVGVDGTLLNPRRERWDPAWRRSAEGPQFREQVEWELRGLELADVILTYFDPATRSPITLLELGLYARSGKFLVCCPAGFWRKGNVESFADATESSRPTACPSRSSACARRSQRCAVPHP